MRGLRKAKAPKTIDFRHFCGTHEGIRTPETYRLGGGRSILLSYVGV